VWCGDLDPLHWDDFADAVSMFVLRFDSVKTLLYLKERGPNDPDPLKEAQSLGPSVLVKATNNMFRRSNDNLIVERQKTLETLISSLTAYESSDPRDIIYAVLSIAKDTWRGHPNVYFTQPDDARKSNLPNIQEIDNENDQNGNTNHLDGRKGSYGFPVLDQINGSQVLKVGDTDHGYDSAEIPVSNDPISPPSKTPPAQSIALHPWRSPPRPNYATPTGTDLLKYHNITADYEKDLLEVCKDFVKSSIKGSGSLDIICRHWAPVIRRWDLTEQDLKLGLTEDLC